MNADQVRALVAAKWPEALKSPVAVACANFAVTDATERAIEFASLQARATEADAQRLRSEALDHAEACLNACDGWNIETLGHNIESAFGDVFDEDECDNIAREALQRRSYPSA